MAYTSADKIRDEILGVDSTDAPDSILNALIVKSDRTVLEDISVKVIMEAPTGIGSSKITYELDHYPLGDENTDGIVSTDDIVVRGWSTQTTSTTLTVASIVPETGRFTLSTAFSDTTYPQGMTVDYRYYPGPVDYSLVELASGQYAGFLWLLKEHSLMPLKLKMGGRKGLETSYGYTVPTYPYDKMLEMYYYTIDRIRAKQHRVVQMDQEEDFDRKLNGVDTR